MSTSTKRRLFKGLYPILLAVIAAIAIADSVVDNNHSVGENLRVYRIAVAATGEFTNHHGGTKAGALQAIQAIIGEVNKVYEQELAIRLEVISMSDSVDPLDIIFTNAATDPYSGTLSNHVTQNRDTINSIVGEANYDIGHVFGQLSTTGLSRGRATIGSVGVSPHKAEGASQSDNPSASNASFVGIVMHEIGHQFGAEHTFNAIDDSNIESSCTTAQYDSTNAFEPASGSTIMSYAGICDVDNLQSTRDSYFHAVSFEQINEHIASYPPLTTQLTGNSVPSVDAGSDFTIPANTPFELTASGSDADDDQLTYTWEQLDRGASMGLPLFDNGFSPLFRSFLPSSNPTRTFPRLSDLLANTLDSGETLPTTNRSLNFRVTARDHNPAGGGISSSDVLLTVKDTGNAFAVMSPNGGESWTGGSTQIVTWEVAGTTANGIDSADVDVLFSTDGGLTFPYLLATTPNNGSTAIVMPNTSSSQARIKIQGSGNIFFDVSNANFTLTADPASPGITVTSTTVSEDGFIGSYDLALNTDPAASVTVLATSDAQSEISTDGISYNTTASLSFATASSSKLFVRALDDSLVEGGHTTTILHTVSASDSVDYPLGASLPSALHQIVDNDARPVVGIDFDYLAFGTSPPNWTGAQLGGLGVTLTDLVRDDGQSSTIDFTLRFTSFGSTNISTAGGSLDTVPQHQPPLTEFGGFNATTASFRCIWSDLTPGRRYHVYVIGLDVDSGSDLGQTVTITGATVLPTFTQALPENVYVINQTNGSSATPLQAAAMTVAADSNGEIKIELAPSGDQIGLAGLAIGAADAIPMSIVATDASAAEPSNNAEFEISLPAGDVAPAGGVSVDYAITGTATNATDFANLTGTATIAQGAQNTIITLNTVDDADEELPESAQLTLTQTFDPWFVLGPEATRSASATIISDEQSGFQSWATSAFSLADLLDPTKEATLWGDLADPDGDSLTNLQEYFHATSPLTIDDDPTTSATTTSGGIEYLELVFPRRKNYSGLTQLIQEAAMPATGAWGPASGVIELTSDTDASTETVRARFPMGTQTRRFLRLRLEEN